MADVSSLQEAQRLHPLTLIQRLLVSLPGLALVLLPVLRSPDRDAWLTILFGLAYGFVALPLIVLQYVRFRFWINPRELVIHSGVLTRQHRNIPIERIQNIEIEQSLLPRLLGIAKVSIETAGSTSTEGVLEYVSIEDARRIRSVIRAFQQQRGANEAAGPTNAHVPEDAPRPARATQASPPVEVFSMSFRRVLLSGAFRFSLIYIAIAFSAVEYLDLRPDEIADWIVRGRAEMAETVADNNPWLLVLSTVVMVALLAWLSGILIQLNRYYGFRLLREGDKLHKRHGLLTVSEGTIPIHKIQALILRTNPMMRHFGWYALELQTVGLDVKERGQQVAFPFAQRATIEAVSRHFYPFTVPPTFTPVSPLMIRRTFVRYVVLLVGLLVPLSLLWRPALWGFVLLPALLGLAWLQYRHHGYAVDGGLLFVQRGVFQQRIWITPIEKIQVLYVSASVFQRRLGLQTVYADTAGASSFQTHDIVDVPVPRGDALMAHLYARLKAAFAGAPPPPGVLRDAAEAPTQATDGP